MATIDDPDDGPAAGQDPTEESLEVLVAELTEAVEVLHLVRERAQGVLHRRARGESYSDILRSTKRPFIAETLARTMGELAEAGSRYRRAQVRALRAEGFSVPDIAVLFGVTRQRVSALLEERRDPG
ncbi:hypothetical protein [Kineococcus sp. SYSU DK001]|uniref:hypothetical protein n=1 Tax=Kineococcus sp. SYSU DK001 TaxID=3383122 RepID=UPI003D7C6844